VGELDRQSVVAKFATTAADGKTYQVEYFNLDAIISLGYRVNSLSFMLAFKVGSTLDSMVGYKSPRFMDFGWASAKLDDVMNFIPARLSFIILFFGAWISGLHPLDGLKVALRDRLKHDSPNAAHAESFFAGSLGVRLCGPVMYPGGLKNKAWLGHGNNDPGPEDISKAALLVKWSAWFALFVIVSALLFLE
jgi:adenosylcobinamide-phosphate synthase